MTLYDQLIRYGIFLHGMSKDQWIVLGLNSDEISVLEWYRDNVGMYARSPIVSVKNGRDAVVESGIPNDNREHLMLICMDEDYKVLGIANIAIGHSTGMLVCRQSILMACCTRRATKCILVHNHEMGGPVSDEDVEFTIATRQLLELAQIELVAHYVRQGGYAVNVMTGETEQL